MQNSTQIHAELREFKDFNIQPGKNIAILADSLFVLLSFFELNVEEDEMCLLLRKVHVSLHFWGLCFLRMSGS